MQEEGRNQSPRVRVPSGGGAAWPPGPSAAASDVLPRPLSLLHALPRHAPLLTPV